MAVNKNLFKSIAGTVVAIDEKKFLSEQTKHDIARVKELIKEFKSMGYYIKYLDQLRDMDKSDIILIPVIIKYIGSFDNFEVESTLLAALGVRGFVKATECLLNEFRKPNSSPIKLPDIAWNGTRRAVASASLWKIRDASHADDYIELIKNVDTHDDCTWIAELVGDIKCEKAHVLLIELLNDSNDSLRSSALRALGKYKNHPEVIPLLEPFTKSKNSAHREYARNSIRKLKKGLGV